MSTTPEPLSYGDESKKTIHANALVATGMCLLASQQL
jgi:hypothetical protein